MYHPVSCLALEYLIAQKCSLIGGTKFRIGSVELDVTGKDGLGGLIEEWFGVWALRNNLPIFNPKLLGNSQSFPDYYVGLNNEGFLEIKSFDMTASANFDIANFESYCESLSINPNRINSDYLIFGYKLNGSSLSIEQIWLKKIWEITCPSERWPLKTQTKRDVIYNIRPAAWYSNSSHYRPFNCKEEFVKALFETQKLYLNKTFTEEERRYYASII